MLVWQDCGNLILCIVIEKVKLFDELLLETIVRKNFIMANRLKLKRAFLARNVLFSYEYKTKMRVK